MTDSMILADLSTWRFDARRLCKRLTPVVVLVAIIGLQGGCEQKGDGDGGGDGAEPIETTPSVSEADIQTALDAAAEHVQADRLHEAAVILDTLVDRAPNHAEVRQARGDVMFRLSEANEKGSDPEAAANLRSLAAAEYQIAAEAAEDNAALWHAAGGMHSAAGNQQAALVAFETAAELDPTQSQYPLFAAQILIATHELDRAEAHLRAALGIDEDLPHAWASLAIVELERANHALAVEHITKARDLAPADVALRAQHARILRRSGDAAESLELLAPLDELTRYQPAVAEELALAYIAVDDLEAAATAWDMAVARDLSLLKRGTVPLELARAHYDAGDRRTAMQWILRAREADLTSNQAGTLQNLEIGVRTGG